MTCPFKTVRFNELNRVGIRRGTPLAPLGAKYQVIVSSRITPHELVCFNRRYTKIVGPIVETVLRFKTGLNIPVDYGVLGFPSKRAPCMELCGWFDEWFNDLKIRLPGCTCHSRTVFWVDNLIISGRTCDCPWRPVARRLHRAAYVPQRPQC